MFEIETLRLLIYFMIRLTLKIQANPEIHLYNKTPLFIGSDASQVDLTMSKLGIQPIHLKIIEQNGQFFLINFVNDPFVTVNGQAFGRKTLKSGDVIYLHEMTLLFELTSSASLLENDVAKEEKVNSISEKKLKKIENVQLSPLEISRGNGTTSPFQFPFEDNILALTEEEFNPSSLNKYLIELENSSQTQVTPRTNSKSEVKKVDNKKGVSLKDDYLRDLDDENNNISRSFGPPRHLYQAWKWILLFIFSLLALSVSIGSVLYFSVSDKTEAHETKAAQGVADLAMALTYAQINQLKPHNQNWSDLDFLKKNLNAILPDISSYAAQINPQGQFHSSPYSLRIYTNRDLSHFLLIAQPAPSLLNWLIPQSLIVVDSQLMELRILKDVRHLNRLLANQDPLEGPSRKEITSLIKEGQLIRLGNLALDSEQEDFSPPKNLAWIKPGAENLIYNAPRYYRLGHPIIEKAIALSSSKGSSQEVAALKQKVEMFSSLNHFILYSDQGKKTALLARQGLMLFAPSEKLLFGYLQLNAQGKIYQVSLLKEDEEIKDSALVSSREGDGVIAFQTNLDHTKGEVVKKNSEDFQIDINHPIYILLHALTQAREIELSPLTISLNNLIDQELSFPQAQFQLEFQKLSHAYLIGNAKHKQLIKEALQNLYQQYENIPIDQFFTFVKALKLEHLIQKENASFSIIDENYHQNIEVLLTYIENGKSFLELDHFIDLTTAWLNLDSIRDPNELMKYQNLIRNQSLKFIEKILLTPKKSFIIKQEDRDLLEHILNQERLFKHEEREFFLKEFDEVIALQ